MEAHLSIAAVGQSVSGHPTLIELITMEGRDRTGGQAQGQRKVEEEGEDPQGPGMQEGARH